MREGSCLIPYSSPFRLTQGEPAIGRPNHSSSSFGPTSDHYSPCAGPYLAMSAPRPSGSYPPITLRAPDAGSKTKAETNRVSPPPSSPEVGTQGCRPPLGPARPKAGKSGPGTFVPRPLPISLAFPPSTSPSCSQWGCSAQADHPHRRLGAWPIFERVRLQPDRSRGQKKPGFSRRGTEHDRQPRGGIINPDFAKSTTSGGVSNKFGFFSESSNAGGADVLPFVFKSFFVSSVSSGRRLSRQQKIQHPPNFSHGTGFALPNTSAHSPHASTSWQRRLKCLIQRRF